MESQLLQLLDSFNFYRKKSEIESIVEMLEYKVGFLLPIDYQEYLANFSAYEGTVNGSFVKFWDIDQLIAYNEGYEIFRNMPNTFGIGSNGTGGLLAMEREDSGLISYVKTPFTLLDPSKNEYLASSFTEFIEKLTCEENLLVVSSR
ncbi:MAG: SMI1/KNR4 family protein [Cyclobacteriaceae bacterium]